MAYYTTLNKIRQHSPCKDGWGKLLRSLGKTEADDEPLSLITILDSNGLDDALWCLRAWIDGAERYANCAATEAELAAAYGAADASSRLATEAAAMVTAEDAAMAAAMAAAWIAAWVAPLVAARYAARAGARDAARAVQEAEFRRRFGDCK
jgi:hypothetical protein